METLIKEKMFSNAIAFYTETTPDKDWKILLESLKTNMEFKEYFIKYLIEENELLVIHLFFSKLFEFSTPITDDIIIEVLRAFSISNNNHSMNSWINNLLICQLIKMGLNDIIYRNELIKLIKERNIPNEDWLDSLLEHMEYYEELGLKSEIKQDYSKALLFYSKSGNFIKINELNETIAMINHHLPISYECIS